MPRVKQYDEEVVLKKAMFSFWTHGFKGVTTRHLADAMGINQYSLYASFESKEKLFEKAIAHYYENIFTNLISKPLLDKDLTIDNLRLFLQQFVDTEHFGFPLGCLIFNSMIENLEPNQKVEGILKDYEAFMKNAFHSIIQRSHPQSNEKFVLAKTDFLYGAFIGLIVKKTKNEGGESVQLYINELLDYVKN